MAPRVGVTHSLSWAMRDKPLVAKLVFLESRLAHAVGGMRWWFKVSSFPFHAEMNRTERSSPRSVGKAEPGNFQPPQLLKPSSDVYHKKLPRYNMNSPTVLSQGHFKTVGLSNVLKPPQPFARLENPCLCMRLFRRTAPSNDLK